MAAGNSKQPKFTVCLKHLNELSSFGPVQLRSAFSATGELLPSADHCMNVDVTKPLLTSRFRAVQDWPLH